MSVAQPQITEDSMQTENGHDQYLTFMLADEEYGVDILRVQEIRGWDSATPVPNMPGYILGVVNLRGTVVPVIDLRQYFNLESIPFDKTTVVIVVKVTDQDEKTERTMGIVVDAVSEVHNISSDELKPAPEFGGALNTDAIKGLATIDDNMLIMLDINELMNNGVLQKLDSKKQS
jgi:purine-binding chemotaxis protein CheW